MFEDALSKLRDLQGRLERVDGTHTLSFTELFPDEFMLRNTDFSSMESLVEASGFSISSSEDFAAIPDAAWDDHIQRNTRFASWKEMTHAASQEWAVRQLDLD